MHRIRFSQIPAGVTGNMPHPKICPSPQKNTVPHSEINYNVITQGNTALEADKDTSKISSDGQESSPDGGHGSSDGDQGSIGSSGRGQRSSDDRGQGSTDDGGQRSPDGGEGSDGDYQAGNIRLPSFLSVSPTLIHRN